MKPSKDLMPLQPIEQKFYWPDFRSTNTTAILEGPTENPSCRGSFQSRKGGGRAAGTDL
jgi:hypothetical protein